MDLIDRYVNDVGRRLPKSQRQEVRDELRSALLDAIEESGPDPVAAAATGGPTEGQVVAALRRMGPPVAVAASYRPSGQYLIGPELYPDFRRVLSFVLALLLALLVGAFAVNLIAQPAASADLGGRLLGLIGGLLDAGWVVFGVVVLIFAGLQRLDVRPDRKAADWDPRELPEVRDEDLVGRGETVFGLVAAGTFLAVLHLFRDRLGFVVEPGGERLLNDVLVRFLPWISLTLLGGMGLKVFLVWRGRWEPPTRVVNLAIDLFGLFVLYRLVAAVAARRAILDSALPAPLPAMLIQIAWVALAVVLAGIAWDTGRWLLRSLRSR